MNGLRLGFVVEVGGTWGRRGRRGEGNCRRWRGRAVVVSLSELEAAVENGDKLQEECGVFAAWGVDGAARACYYGIHSLQHRGQEGAGIVSSDGERLREVKGLGLVSEVFNEENLAHLTGKAAIAHNRYSTSGEKSVKNVQPFTVDFRDGQVAIAHNGNLTNASSLRNELELRGSIFNTSSDTEVILHLMAGSVYAGRTQSRGVQRRIADALNRVEGAYSLAVLVKDQLIAVRDPYGFRPLVMGRVASGGIVFASETCALDIIGAEYVREVEPGEMVTVNKDGMQSSSPFPRQRRRACIFEHIYFARPSSVIFGRNVYMSRFRFGELLSTVTPVDADVVVPVPESGIPAALGYAAASGILFQMGIMRSHYVGRTFIQPTQDVRDVGVKLKLSPVRALIEGKSLVVVDDSIVRGTTSKKIVRMLRESGAREVHMRIACPPIIGSCFYGVDTPNREELISFKKSIEETREYIGADTLAFLPLEIMQDFLGDEAPTFCDGCFSSKYPVPPLDVNGVELDTSVRNLSLKIKQ
mmetsp:Transcript_10235/g.31261  ORF Transcript_10235/g.31261 Transcript_10235/m.31261 type:complete len:528 (+) Transcript_10235:54-1637(+)